MENSYPLQQVLERYNLQEFQLAYRFAEMKNMSLDNGFIFTLLKMFEEDGCVPIEELRNTPLDIIVDYVARTHKYYLSKKLPEIEQSIGLLMLDYSDNHPLLPVLKSFYTKYQSDLVKHIQVEERFVLPHIRLLQEATEKNYSLSEFLTFSKNRLLRTFLDDHTDTEGDLAEVRNAIRQYAPPATNQTPYRILLTQLQLLEKDLSVHAIIEDEVLIPRAMELEDKLTSAINAVNNNLN